MEQSLANAPFTQSIKTLRHTLPRLAFGLLIVTYIISAVIMGMFHAQEAKTTGFMISAFAVPFVIQAGRGTLVFFFQLNPMKVRMKQHFGVIAATLLLVLSLVEASFIMWPQGIAWTVSVATLMIIGWIIEIMILKEVQWSTEMEFFNDPQQVRKLKAYYLARQEFDHFLQALQEAGPYGEQQPPMLKEGQGYADASSRNGSCTIKHLPRPGKG